MVKMSDVPTVSHTAVMKCVVTQANAEDVIYGRGNHLKTHPGNIHYRSLVDALREYYVAFSKDKKRFASKLIYDTIQDQSPPGRFLAESTTGIYVELDSEDAIRKISQCFREKQQVIKESNASLPKRKLTDDEFGGKMQEMKVRRLFFIISIMTLI